MITERKIVVIPDLHGKDVWKKSVKNTKNLGLNIAKVIFLGDYVDSYEHEDEEIIDNLKEIIEFKKQYPDRVELLIGNHDIQYFKNKEHMRCTGFRPSYAFMIQKLFESNKDLFKSFYVVFRRDRFPLVFSHAGISDLFKTKYGVKLSKDEGLVFDDISGVENIGSSRGGSDTQGGLYWADKNETEISIVGGWNQVVGHTKVPEIEYAQIKNFGSIAYCDCLDKKIDFLEIPV